MGIILVPGVNVILKTVAVKEWIIWVVSLWQSFGDLVHKPLLVDLTVEEGQRLKVIYGSCSGFHAVDVDSGAVYDIYLPTHVCSDEEEHWAVLLTLHLSLSLLLDSEQHSVARHHHSAQHGRHRAAGVLRGRGRVCQHLRPHHQRRGASVGRDAHVRRYSPSVTFRETRLFISP